MNAIFIIADILSILMTFLMVYTQAKLEKHKTLGIIFIMIFSYISAMLVTATILLWR